MIEVVSIWLYLVEADLNRELSRWPGRDYCSSQMAFNEKYESWLKANWPLHPGQKEWFADAFSETKRIYNIYDWLRDAGNRNANLSYRIEALGVFRNLIGEEAWCDGRVPPAVPLWRFSEVPIP